MFNSIVKIVKNIKFKTEPVMPLGRWHHDCEKSQAIKAMHANHDSCGDRLCGTPLFVKKLANEEIDKIPDYDLEVNPNVIDKKL
jgi:hypothetical protein